MTMDIWAERMNPHHNRTGDHRTPADIDYFISPERSRANFNLDIQAGLSTPSRRISR